MSTETNMDTKMLCLSTNYNCQVRRVKKKSGIAQMLTVVDWLASRGQGWKYLEW
jgi:hypothetical protein